MHISFSYAASRSVAVKTSGVLLILGLEHISYYDNAIHRFEENFYLTRV